MPMKKLAFLTIIFINLLTCPAGLTAESEKPVFVKSEDPGETSAKEIPKEPFKKYGDVFLIANFENTSGLKKTKISCYEQPPSKAQFKLEKLESGEENINRVAKIKYFKAKEGGPFGKGGWCGWYVLIKRGSRYFDASEYGFLTFRIKGNAGDEKMVVGLRDKTWDKYQGDSMKSRSIGYYLTEGKITDKWQKAIIPLSDFPEIDLSELSGIYLCFEGYLFADDRPSKGIISIDDIQLEIQPYI